MNTLNHTIHNLAKPREIWIQNQNINILNAIIARRSIALPKFTPLAPLRQWLEHIEVKNPNLAHFLCKLIPAQCPFERDITFFDKTLFHIPPMCKLNPVYDELIGIRFRALCYLADVCGEDIAPYC
ncbi:MAG: Mo-dependent nitrogenase C-terminal domain-containing protein [Microcoleaceae cyanobacterium]